jgi:hypothetical protein
MNKKFKKLKNHKRAYSQQNNQNLSYQSIENQNSHCKTTSINCQS